MILLRLTREQNKAPTEGRRPCCRLESKHKRHCRRDEVPEIDSGLCDSQVEDERRFSGVAQFTKFLKLDIQDGNYLAEPHSIDSPHPHQQFP
ncbi:hypothetical protein TNCV_4475941 [Trichonephila clavipes]|nr:hypothetical protein TNCV_4475941 [Trichonephila clavipes]